MRYKAAFSMLLSLFIGTANANWEKVSEVDYTWGPFDIYHITLFTETGTYNENIRPLMLSLQYKKPWEGRDFAAFVARIWKSLEVKLPEERLNAVITNLRKTFPDIKPEDKLHYIAFENRGYFILNDRIVSEVFDKAFSDAIVAIWLDPKVDISHQLVKQPEASSTLLTTAIEQPKLPESSTSTGEMPSTESSAIEPQNRFEEGNTVEPAKVEQEEKTTVEAVQQENSDTVIEPKKVETSSTIEVKQESISEKENIKEPTPKTEIKQAEKPKETAKKPEIENPEVFISPIYDDILMLSKNYS